MGILDGLFSPTKNAKEAGRVAIADFNKTRDVTDPFYTQNLNNGASANSILADRLGVNGQASQATAQEQFLNSPAFDYNFAAGTKAIDNSGSARGMSKSGAQLKELQEFGQSIYAQDYNNQNAQLAGLNQLGFSGANGLTQNSASYGQQQMNFGQLKDAGNAGAIGNVLNLAGTVAGFGGGGGFSNLGSSLGNVFGIGSGANQNAPVALPQYSGAPQQGYNQSGRILGSTF